MVTPTQKKVLLADDEEDILALSAAALGTEERYQLILAHNGQEAIDLALQERPDIAVLDIVMPRKSGWEVCRELKSHPDTRDMKVIIISALNLTSQQDKAAGSGYDAFLSKPFSLAGLRSKVQELLELN